MLELVNISKSFDSTPILKNVNFTLNAGQSVAVVGPSGSGKTTLLNIASLLDVPSSGDILYFNTKIQQKQFTEVRKKHIAFVYQQHNLMPEFTVLENIEVVAKIKGVFTEGLAYSLLEEVGLKNHIHTKPAELSGGQKQRASIVRAICAKPKILFADEPTGNLDPKSSKVCGEILTNLAKSQNVALFLITHNLDIAKMCNTVYQIDETSSLKQLINQ